MAEAKAVLGDVRPLQAGSVAIIESEHWDGAVLQDRLAGTVKLGDIIDERTPDVLDEKLLADHIEARPRADRILFGLTIVGGTSKQLKSLKNLPILLKRELQDRGKSVRWVTGDNGSLAPAAVSKLGLTTDGYDFVIAIHGETASIGLTTHVQNIDAWSLRDFGRPFRDAKTGMLPPKLARMMVNLAAPKNSLLDPFCGSGTVVMEAALLHDTLALVGSDIDARQIAGAKENFEWLMSKELLRRSDAERIDWKISPAQELDKHLAGKTFDAIVTEGYLGKPLQGNEPQKHLDELAKEVETVWNKSLHVLAKLQPSGGRLVAIWPELTSSHGSSTVDASKAAKEVGYISSGKSIIYARPDQHIRRHIVTLVKE